MVSVVDGSLLTDASIADLVTHCPNLKSLSMIGAPKLTNASFEIAVSRLSRLELLRITGRSPFKPPSVCGSGKFKTNGTISLLRERGHLAGNLKMLHVAGHDGISFEACRKLSDKRRGLEIVVGSTGPVICTYWEGVMVHTDENPYPGAEGSGSNSEVESGSYDDNEVEYSDPEDGGMVWQGRLGAW